MFNVHLCYLVVSPYDRQPGNMDGEAGQSIVGFADMVRDQGEVRQLGGII